MLEVGLDYGACLRGQGGVGGLCFKKNNGKHLVGRTRGRDLHQESQNTAAVWPDVSSLTSWC